MTAGAGDDPWPALVRYVESLLASNCRRLPAADAPDLVQDSLFALFRQQLDKGPLRDCRVWLIKVVSNLDVERVRRRRRRREQGLPQDEDQVHGFPGARQPDAWAKLEELLHDAIPGLTPFERAVALALAAGDTRARIAEDMGETRARVAAAAKKVLECLRKYFEQDEE